MLAAASVLERRGHEVAVLASGQTREAAQRLGFEVRGYRRSPDPDVRRLRGSSSDTDGEDGRCGDALDARA